MSFAYSEHVLMNAPHRPRPNMALFYHPDGFDTAVPRLMGRQAAGEGFLRGWVRYAGVDQMYCHANAKASAQHFADTVKAEGWAGGIRWVPRDSAANLSAAGTLFLPGPGLGNYAWQRRLTDQRGYSLVGVTHTTASHGAMDNIAAMLDDPVQSWDAVICTSRAVHQMVTGLLDQQLDYLSARYGTKIAPPRPQLPIIPLGVDTDAFTHDPDARNHWRRQLGVGDQDVIVLFMGRLSFHAKAHPAAMYTALSRVAAQHPDRRIHLVEAGWYATEQIGKAFDQTATDLLGSVTRHMLDGRETSVRKGIWHAADIFCSLSDNIQETFGLTPVEAMAAGLPCVVSDWNGYKDTVVDGVHGIRVPTWAPPTPLGEDMAQRHAQGLDVYDIYCGQACQFVSVSMGATIEAFNRLVDDADLRRRMGAAARLHAQQTYDWRVVIGQYQELFSELSARRAVDTENVPLLPDAPPWPLRADPFRSFGHYPTHVLAFTDQVVARPGFTPAAVEALVKTPMVSYAQRVLPTVADCTAVHVALTQMGGAASVMDIVARMPVDRRAFVMRGLVWLAKYDLVALLPAPTEIGVP